MTDEELKALVASLAIAQQKNDIQFAETDRKIAALAEQHKEIAKQHRELVEQQKKTDAQLAKTDAQLAKTDAQLAKTDAQLAKTDAHLDKVSAKIDRIADLVGNISNNQGELAEDFFYRSLVDNTQLGKMHFDIVYRNQSAHKNKVEDEFDIVLLNENSVAVIEVKQKAHPKLIDEMLNRKLPNFRLLYPHYKHQKLYGAIASMVTNDELIQRAKEAGLFFLTQKAEHLVLINDEVRYFSS